MNVIHGTPEPSPKPREARRAQTSDALLERALEITEKDGLDALTLQGVAKTLGYVTTAVYRYFPSKDALVAALQRKAIADLHDHFRAELAERAASVASAAAPTRHLAALLAAADIYLCLPSTRPRSWHLVARLLGDPRPLISDEESLRTAPALAALLGDVRDLFVAAAAEGALTEGDARERTLVFWSVCHGALCMEKVRRIAPDLPTARQVGLAGVKKILQAEGASPARLAASLRALEKNA